MTLGTLSIPKALSTGKLISKVRGAIEESRSDFEGKYESLSQVATEVEELLQTTPTDCLGHTWKLMRTGLATLSLHGKSLAIAHGAKGDLTAEQSRLKVLFSEVQSQLRGEDSLVPNSAKALSRQVCSLSDCDVSMLAELMLTLPLPVSYREVEEEQRFEIPIDKAATVPPPPIVRIVASLDAVPIATPQLINPGRLYSLKFRIRGISWPEGAESLQLALLSTCPQEEYSLSSFELSPPTLNAEYEYESELSGNIKFNSAQSTLLDDIVFRLDGAFKMPDAEFKKVPIIGYHELRLKVVNQDRHPLMRGNHSLDRHIDELLTKLIHDCPRVAEELDDLFPLLRALNLLLTTYALDAVYKGVSNLLESEFHEKVLHDLRLQLGADVQNHPNQVGGISDIKYRKVITELKVERQIGDRHKVAKKYSAQGTQYQGAEGRQVSVLLVLDLTPKTSPPGDLRNDVLLVDVPTHGGADENKTYPSKAFVFVLNGNIKSPSDYS